MNKDDIKLCIGFAIFLIIIYFVFKNYYANMRNKEQKPSEYSSHYRIDNDRECNCEEYENEVERIKDNLYDIINNSDDYSKQDILNKIKSLY